MMLKLKSYTDEFYIQEIQKENKKVIDHFYIYSRDYFRRTYKKLFLEESVEADFFQESFIKLWKEIRRGSIFVQDNQIYKKNAAGEINPFRCSLRTFICDEKYSIKNVVTGLTGCLQQKHIPILWLFTLRTVNVAILTVILEKP